MQSDKGIHIINFTIINVDFWDVVFSTGDVTKSKNNYENFVSQDDMWCDLRKPDTWWKFNIFTFLVSFKRF